MQVGLDRSWAEISLDALINNCRLLRKMVRPSARLMAVVKADAYGHGAVEVAKICLAEGFDYLAVSMLDEALALRQAGIDAPILVLSYTESCRAVELIDNDITQAVYSWELLRALSETAVKLGKKAKLHIKLDTGMSRIGFTSSYNSVDEIIKMMNLPNLIFEGIFTHFATADSDDGRILESQFDKFMSICLELERLGYKIPLKHCCNSAAILKKPEYHLDMVRAGIALYGHSPFAYNSPADQDFRRLGFRPLMSFYSRIIQIKKYKEPCGIGYGHSYIAKKNQWIATVPVGYADGCLRALSGKLSFRLYGESCYNCGKICMDASMFDITPLIEKINVAAMADGSVFADYPEPLLKLAEMNEDERLAALMNTEVLLFGDDNNQNLDQLLADTDIINYEILSLIGKRVVRVYLKDEIIVHIYSSILR